MTVKRGHILKTFVFYFTMGEIKEKEDNWECKFSEEVGRDGIQSAIGVITLIGKEGKKDSADVGKCVGEVTGG